MAPTMPRFTIRSLLVATALIAAGLAMLISGDLHTSSWFWRIGIGWPLIGAGALTPLGRPWLGVAIGCLVLPALVVLGLIAIAMYGPYQD
jgi:hypothetical protein